MIGYHSGVFCFLRTAVQDLLDGIEDFVFGLAIPTHIDPFFPAAHRGGAFSINGGFVRAIVATVAGEGLTFGGVQPLGENSAADKNVRALLAEPEAGELAATIGGRPNQVAHPRRV